MLNFFLVTFFCIYPHPLEKNMKPKGPAKCGRDGLGLPVNDQIQNRKCMNIIGQPVVRSNLTRKEESHL